MANPNGHPQSLKAINPGRWPTSPLKEARLLQRLAFAKAIDPVTDAALVWPLVRSYVALQETIRVMRGIPSPGQYRPDLHPDQLLKALKRAKLSRHEILDAPAFAGPRTTAGKSIDAEPVIEPGPTPTTDPQPTTDETPTTDPKPEPGPQPGPGADYGMDPGPEP